jgi:hypothetical protein
MAQFSNYGDVQAALDREHQAWLRGETVGQTQEGTQARDWWQSYTSPASNTSQPAPPPPTPVYVAPPPPPPPTTFAVKQAEPDIILFDQSAVPEQLLTDLIFEDIGGTELINISRNDTVNGQNVIYSVIKKLSILNQAFNPNNILAGQSTTSAFFNQYAIDIVGKLPEINAVSLDAEGNMIIEFTSIGADEYLEAEISSSGTIYKVEIE